MYRFLLAMMITVSLTLLPATCRAADTQQENEDSESPDCVYVGTPYDVIDAMMDTGSIERGDVVYDLGCGDGRIIVAVAKRFGCRGVGYDIDPVRIEESLENVREAGVGDLVEIEKKNIFKLDLSQANVIMLYLLPEMQVRLIPQLKKLKPGSQIVTHNYAIEGIAHKRSLTIPSLEDGVEHYVYLYEAPLKEQDEESDED